MATLRSDNWSFEIRYAGWEYGWLRYQFWFRWKGEIVVKESLLKLKDASAYGGGGLAIELLVERQELVRFADELEAEYRKICHQPKGGEDWDA